MKKAMSQYSLKSYLVQLLTEQLWLITRTLEQKNHRHYQFLNITYMEKYCIQQGFFFLGTFIHFKLIIAGLQRYYNGLNIFTLRYYLLQCSVLPDLFLLFPSAD